MFSSGAMFASQGFSMGGLDSTQPTQAMAGEGAAKKPRQESKDTCLPVTIRAIDAAFQAKGDDGEDLRFFGCAEPSMVLLVAAVESVARQAASLEVSLNDGTGRMKGRWFLTDPEDAVLDRIVAGSYVSLFGELRAAPMRHISVKGMRPVESADEVSYHIVEVAHAALKLQGKGVGNTVGLTALAPEKAEAATSSSVPQPSLAATAAAPAAAPAVLEPQAANPYAAAAAAKVAAPPSGAELRATVLAALRDGGVGPEGLHLDVISQKAGGAEVKAIVSGLVDDGELYTTITEEHFAAV